jgi:outer membrane biosynthesis protein TonB
LKIVAEQNSDILKQIEMMKNDTREAFEQLAKDIEANLVAIKDESNDKCRTLGDGVKKVYQKISKLEAIAKTLLTPTSKVKNVQERKSRAKPTSSIRVSPPQPPRPKAFPTPSKANSKPLNPKVTVSAQPKKSKPATGTSAASKSKLKVLYVADSVGHP